MASEPITDYDDSYDVIVVGAGIAGIYALHRLRSAGLSVRVLEAGDGVGGTWYWNRYPGARCDVEALAYSYSFDDELQQEWEWTERYPTQPQILSYLRHVVERYDLADDIQLGTRVTAAEFDDEIEQWLLTTQGGQRFSAPFCVMATGCLNVEKLPEIAGIESFAGEWHHTSNWPQEPVDVRGKRVGVIGTGSTGIQVIPVLAETVGHLYVFQRTANFSYPARNAPLDPEFVRTVKASYNDFRERARVSPFASIPVATPPRERLPTAAGVDPAEREIHLRTLWEWGHAPSFLAAFQDVMLSEETNDLIADFFRERIRERVGDPEIAERLVPRGFPIGTRRMCLDTDYYETFRRDNVTLVDVREAPIQRITPSGVRTEAGEYDVDVLVFATGFDAMTGSLLAIDIRGGEGRSLREDWKDGPSTYLGLGIAGYPNLFLITGPQSPSVLTNMAMSIEQHVEWIGDCLERMRERGDTRIEPTQEAQDAWVDHANEVAERTLFRKAVSWYTGANIEGKPRGLMPYVGGAFAYREKLAAVVDGDYEGFRRSSMAPGLRP